MAGAFNTITAEDFAAYSPENQKLILDILGYQAELNEAAGQVENFSGTVGGPTKAVDTLAQAIEQAKSGIRDWLDKIFLSNLSPLTPQERLDKTQAAYGENLMNAQAGNADALANFTQFANAYLREAQAFWASSPEYKAIFEAVTGQAKDLAGLEDAGPVTRRDARRNAQDIVDAIDGVRDEILALRNGQAAVARERIKRQEATFFLRYE